MSRESIYSRLDRHVSSLEPDLVCNHKPICGQRTVCKRKEISGSNSIVFVPIPKGCWGNCQYFVEKEKNGD